MSPHQYMFKQMHRIGGGIAWTRDAFTAPRDLDPEALVDAAVDLAWHYLTPPEGTPRELDIRRQDNLVVFRLRPPDVPAGAARADREPESASTSARRPHPHPRAAH